jgi:hypothetical protein
MFKFFLIVMFFNAQGEVVNKDGWYPREQPNWKVCIERRNFARKHHKTKEGVTAKWFCRKVMR